MLKDTHTTDVIFRKYKDGDIIALMPHEVSNFDGSVTSYMHVGQHGDANFWAVMATTRPANEFEAADLKAELESIGYKVKVVKKQIRKKFIDSWNQIKK